MGRTFEVAAGLVAALFSWVPFLLNLVRSLFTIGAERRRVAAALGKWGAAPESPPKVDTADKPWTVFVIAGEASGDRLAASVVKRLKRRHKGVRVRGFGGPRMAEAGCELDEDLVSDAVMGVTAVLAQAPRFVSLFARYLRILDEERPDAVLMVDYPGFNFRAGSAARRRGVPVTWYVLPQIWAWAPWRAGRVAAAADHRLAILPFEPEFYADRGIETSFAGYPLFADRDREPVNGRLATLLHSAPGPLVAVLPGSRRKEVRDNLPGLLVILERLRERMPHLRAVIASASPKVHAVIEEMLPEGADVSVVDGGAHTVLSEARVALCVSGTVTMDCVHADVPAVVAYRIGALSRVLKPLLVTSPHIAMANLLAGEEIYPETHDPVGDADRMAAHLESCMRDGDERDRIVAATEKIRRRLTEQHAASLVTAALAQSATG
ncbi:MAG: lipid-A-disaccharide synthase [Planctomycetota bacterium]